MRKEWLGLCALMIGCAGEEPVDLTGNLYTVDYSTDGKRFAKRDKAKTIAALREQGYAPAEVRKMAQG